MTALPQSSPRFRWAVACVFLALAVAGAWAWRLHAAPEIIRVLLLDAEVGAAANMDPQECATLNRVVKDHLEIVAGASVSQTLGIPGPKEWPGLRKDALVLRLAPWRSGEGLRLRGSWARVVELQQNGEWHAFDITGATPTASIEKLVNALPLTKRKVAPANIAPRNPAVFWKYLAAHGGAPGTEFQGARDLLDACAAAEPDCAAIPLAQGELQFFHALQAPTNDTESLRLAETLLQRGLDLFPNHPRGTWLLSRLRTDTGNAKEALELLLEARRVYPMAIPLMVGITYAGRYAGLLELAARAEGRSDELSADPAHPVRLQVTFLYLGEWDRYDRSLWTRPGDVTNSAVLLFRGQLELARGRKDRALEAFREASESPVGYSQFIRMARVFRLILEGDATARQELDTLAENRVGLRVPDGEFILNIAEAYVLVGDLPRAQELTEKAFYTGFTCARWYETNPLLKPLRGTSRWNSMMQHVRERQAILEARFPERRWGI